MRELARLLAFWLVATTSCQASLPSEAEAQLESEPGGSGPARAGGSSDEATSSDGSVATPAPNPNAPADSVAECRQLASRAQASAKIQPKELLNCASVLEKTGDEKGASDAYMLALERAGNDVPVLWRATRLSDKLPLARATVEAYRKRLQKDLLAGCERSPTEVVVTLNALQRRDERTVSLYRTLSTRADCAEATAAMFGRVVVELARKGDYQLVLRDRQRAEEMLRQRLQLRGTGLDTFIVTEGGAWFEAVASTRDDAVALQIAEDILAAVPTADAYESLIARAVRAGNRTVGSQLLKRGVAKLSDFEHDRLRKALAGDGVVREAPLEF